MPARKIRALYFFVLVLLILLALVLSIWSARTQLAEYTISAALIDAGLMNVSTDIQQLDSRQSVISHITFTLPTKTGLLHVNINAGKIYYKPERLKFRKIDRLLIEDLLLRFEDNSSALPGTYREDTEASADIQPVQVIASLRQVLDEYLFFDTLLIQKLALRGSIFSVFQDKIYRLSSHADDTTIQAEITLLDSTGEQAEGLPKLVISKLSAELLNAEFKLNSTASDKISQPPASLEVKILDQAVNANYRVNLQSMQAWLQPFGEISPLVDHAHNENLSGSLSFIFINGRHIESTLTANSDNLQFGAYRADNVSVKAKVDFTVNPAAQDTVLQAQIKNGSYIQAGDFRINKLSLTDSRIYIVGKLINSDQGWFYNGGLNWKLLSLGYDSGKSQFKDITARITASKNTLSMSGFFSPALLPGKFSFDLQHKIDDKAGVVSIKPVKPLQLDAEDRRLSQLLTPWPYPFDLLAGNIRLFSDASWSSRSPLNLTAVIKVDNAGGNINEQVFSGLAFDHRLEILPVLHSISSSKINLLQIDSGVTASNIRTDLLLEATATGPLPRLVMKNIYGEILGGTFSSDNLNYDLNRSRNSFQIKARNIDLAEIVKTQQLNDITATGRIDGTIPVEINEDGVFIEHGAFLNEVRSGTIRYNPKAGTEQLKNNPLTGIALDALKDFHYSHLSAGVNFTPEGVLSVDLHLKGTSPALETNRPVHLNINTEQNLLSLLKSLRYAQGISESIDKKVRRQYEKKQ